jgi:hypothetical protein
MAWFVSGALAMPFSSRDLQALKKKITRVTHATAFAMLKIIAAS